MKPSPFATYALLGAFAVLGACSSPGSKQSIEHQNRGAKAFKAANFDSAAQEYKEAARLDPTNHLAWFGLGLSYLKRDSYKESADALAQATKLLGGNAVYAEKYGIALYRAAEAAAREAQARAAGKQPGEIELDYSKVDFGKVTDQLEAAIKLEPKLVDATYFLSRAYLYQGKEKQAAELATTAIGLDPLDYAPYVTLANLYLKWDYVDEAIAVAEAGAKAVEDALDRSEVSFLLGLGRQRKGDVAGAIEAYTAAIDDRKDNNRARFQRGQLLFQKAEYKKAKEDLETYAKAAGKSAMYEKSVAQRLVGEIMSKGIQ